MSSRQSSSSLSSNTLLPPQISLLYLCLSTLSPASTNLTQRYGKVKRRERIHLKDCLQYSVWLLCSDLRVAQTTFLVSLCFTVIHSIHNTDTDSGTFLSNQKFGNVFLREGAFALVFDTFVFIKKRKTCILVRFFFVLIVCIPQLLTALSIFVSAYVQRWSPALEDASKRMK